LVLEAGEEGPKTPPPPKKKGRLRSKGAPRACELLLLIIIIIIIIIIIYSCQLVISWQSTAYSRSQQLSKISKWFTPAPYK
jgi:flagellar basal body-associated protein FliL